MKLSIISFRPNPRIVAKFQTDRLRTFWENRAEKKRARGKTYTLAAATLRYADARGQQHLEIFSNYVLFVLNNFHYKIKFSN